MVLPEDPKAPNLNWDPLVSMVLVLLDLMNHLQSQMVPLCDHRHQVQSPVKCLIEMLLIRPYHPNLGVRQTFLAPVFPASIGHRNRSRPLAPAYLGRRILHQHFLVQAFSGPRVLYQRLLVLVSSSPKTLCPRLTVLVFTDLRMILAISLAIQPIVILSVEVVG